MEIGDKVQWVPSIDHHLEFVPWANLYAWEHTVTRRAKYPAKVGEEVVQSVTDIRKAINASAKKNRQPLEALTPTKPQTTYPAVVKAISEDGTVSLDITSPIGGITLHYDNVLVDPNGAPGTCKE
jgi:hypothetical protein